MDHDVFLCYAKEDEKYANAVSRIFEENNIKTWIKSKFNSSDVDANIITEAIAKSKCLILVYSNNSKDSNYIINETDIAFSKEIPILLFNIDDSPIQRDLEFMFINATKINSFPNAKKQLRTLVKETSSIIGKPVEKIKVNSESVKIIDEINPKKKDNKIKKIALIVILAIVAIGLIYFLILVPTGQHTTDDGIFAMNVTGVDISESNGVYNYKVLGESYNLPDNSSKYFMNVKFFDKNDNMVYEVNSTADEFKLGQICNCNIPEDNVTHIGFRLVDINDNLLSEQDYVIGG